MKSQQQLNAGFGLNSGFCATISAKLQKNSGYGVELVTSVTAKISSAPQSSNCNKGDCLLTGARREEEFPQCRPPTPK
jgi:hypothetical protein